MPHHPKPFFKKSRQCWYVEINRKQIRLGTEREKAFDLYHQLMTQPREQPVTAGSLVELVDLFLDWVQKRRSRDTYEWYRYRLRRLVDKFPSIRAMSLRPHHVEEWVDSYGTMAVTTRRNYLRSVKRCLTWAVRQGYLERNPIDSLEIPGGERREVYVTPEEYARLLQYAPDPGFRDLIRVTYLSGCRPQESLIVKTEHVDVKHCRWVFPQNQAKGKQAPRIVYLTEAAMEIIRELMVRFPDGTLFRNADGNPWTTEAVNCSFDRIQTRMGKAMMTEVAKTIVEDEIAAKLKTLKTTKTSRGVVCQKTAAELRCEAKQKLLGQKARDLVPHYSLYALRHSWATNALKSGVDALTVAILMGHKEPSMLARVYQHLSHSPEHMLNQAERAIGNQPSKS
jgi:integrase